jgi:hypothetical protein
MSILSWLAPVQAIASELTLIRRLYELDMRSRGFSLDTPVPSKGDLEISYSGEEERPGMRQWLSVEEEEELRGEE